MKKQHNTLKQSGATLLISLIMLLILTIIGVSSIEDVSLQSNMTRNSQFKMQAFNTSMSESEAQLPGLNNQIALLIEAKTSCLLYGEIEAADLIMPSAENPFFQEAGIYHIPEGENPRYRSSAASTCTDSKNSTDNSTPGKMMSDNSAGVFTPINYELNSTATLLSSGSKSDQLQGFRYQAPAG